MKYVTRPKAEDWEHFPVEAVTTREVIVSDDAPVKTGLIDQTGAPIYRVRDSIPFGFVKG